MFLLAGHGTTAATLTFTLSLPGRRPEAQQRLHVEVDAVLGGRPAGAEDLAALPYTTMVVREALRLYPPAWILPRQSAAEARIDGYAIPAGPMAFACPWVTHRHPGFWDEHARFCPDRFKADAARPRYAYFSFGGGPHTCIGVHFAMLEAGLLLATVAQAFSLAAPAAAPALMPAVTLQPRDPVPIVLTPR